MNESPASSSDTPQLMALLYDELRSLATDYLKRERPGHTLQPTALVHEAYMRLAGLRQVRWRDETHFKAAAAGTIRRVLVDHARGKGADKRGAGRNRVTLSGIEGVTGPSELDLLALDDAIEKLATLDERKTQVVELRFFGGLTIDETAAALGVGTTTVEDDWAFARSWLRRELRGEDE